MWNFCSLSKKKVFRIIKLFKIVDYQKAQEIEAHEIISKYIELMNLVLKEYPDHYEINYGQKQWRSKTAFYKNLSKIDNSRIVHSIVMDSKTKSYFSYNNSILDIDKDIMPEKAILSIELVLKLELMSTELLKSFISTLYFTFNYEYGYSLDLPENYDFGTERKMKKTLFGYKSTSNSFDKVWRFHSVGIKRGFIKDIYPVNIINSSHLSQDIFKTCMSLNIGKFEEMNENIWLWTLNDEQLSRAYEIFNNSYLIISNKNHVRKFLDSKEAKEFLMLMQVKNN